MRDGDDKNYCPQPAAVLPEVLAALPKPELGAVVESLVSQAAGGLVKAPQIVFSKLAGSRSLSAVVPLITKVGEPATLYLALSSLKILKAG